MAKPIFLAAVAEVAPLPGMQVTPSPYEKVTVGVNEVLGGAQLILMLKLVPFASVFVPLLPVKTKSFSVAVGTVTVLGTVSEHVGTLGVPRAQAVEMFETVAVRVVVENKGQNCHSSLTVPENS